MEYNTQRSKLIISEYGRNIQKLIEHAITLKDTEERNKFAKMIINVMGQLNPHLRDVNDFKHKLWNHLFVISDFKLDVDSPYTKPTTETLSVKPERMLYPDKKIKYKHYGKTIELMIKKAATFEEGDEKDALIKTIANHLKKSYLTWNKDSVTDEKILKDLEELSDGKLSLRKNVRLNYTSDILASSKRKKRVVKSNNTRTRRRKY
ncbi:MAG: DUF4290 domain-containing protein [Bacteroidota bacterium]